MLRRNKNARNYKNSDSKYKNGMWPPEPKQRDTRMNPNKGSGRDQRVAQTEQPFGGRK
jgi:hypothetical protein